MKHDRNVEGLRQNAQKKRQQALEKTAQGIRQLLKDGRLVNFETVAEAAGVSKAWLYKRSEIKEQIEQLRAQGTGKMPVTLKPKASDASKEAINKTLKERIKRLEAEVKGLREHIEVISGQNYILEEENSRLKKQLASSSQPTNLTDKKDSIFTQKIAPPNFSKEIQAELESLEVNVNSTLRKLISQTSEDVVLKAIETLKQQVAIRTVSNLEGFLVEAIRGDWDRNAERQRSSEHELFNEWYFLARALNLVLGSQEIEGVLHVYTKEGEVLPFKEVLAQYPLEELQKT